jgi:hypothetical protein
VLDLQMNHWCNEKQDLDRRGLEHEPLGPNRCGEMALAGIPFSVA